MKVIEEVEAVVEAGVEEGAEVAAGAGVIEEA